MSAEEICRRSDAEAAQWYETRKKRSIVEANKREEAL